MVQEKPDLRPEQASKNKAIMSQLSPIDTWWKKSVKIMRFGLVAASIYGLWKLRTLSYSTETVVDTETPPLERIIIPDKVKTSGWIRDLIRRPTYHKPAPYVI